MNLPSVSQSSINMIKLTTIIFFC